MEQTVTKPAIKGLLISLILIIIALATYFLDIKVQGPVQYVGYAIFIGGIIWSIISYGKQINHIATFGKYFSHGFKVAAIVTLVMIVYMVIFLFVFPDFKETAMAEAKKGMVAKGNLTPEQISQGLEMTRKFFTVFLIGATLVGYLFFGALAALIGAAVTKKEPNKIVDEFTPIG